MLTSTPTPSSQGLHVTFRGGDVCAGCRLTGRDQVRGSRPRGTRAPVLTRWPPLQGRLLRISHAAGLELDFVHYNVPEEVGPIVSALFCAGAEAAGFPSGAGGLSLAGAPRDPAGLAGVLAPLPAAEAAALLANVPAADAAAALQVRARPGRGATWSPRSLLPRTSSPRSPDATAEGTGSSRCSCSQEDAACRVLVLTGRARPRPTRSGCRWGMRPRSSRRWSPPGPPRSSASCHRRPPPPCWAPCPGTSPTPCARPWSPRPSRSALTSCTPSRPSSTLRVAW